MKVLHMFTNPHLTNGASVFEYELSKRLARENVILDHLVTESPTGSELERYGEQGSTVYQLPIDNDHGLLIQEIKINYQYLGFFKSTDMTLFTLAQRTH